MPTTIGTFVLNQHTVERDQVVYATASHNVSQTDTIALRRTLPMTAKDGSKTALRTNLRAERSFTLGESTSPVVVNVSVSMKPGINAAAASSYIDSVLTDFKGTVKHLATTGDVYVGEV